MNRQKTSVVWKPSKEEFQKLVSSSKSIADIIRHFGLVGASANYDTVKKRISEENIDASHIPLGLGSNKGRKFGPSKDRIPTKDLLVEDSSYSRGHLKKRLLQEKLIENKCQECGLHSEWNGKSIILVLDHINGVNNDNRLENLRMLCPNCNSQMPTFAGKQLRLRGNCSNCGKDLSRNKNATGMCLNCCNKLCEKRKTYKVPLDQRPGKEELKEMIDTMSWCAIGRKYGVSDNSVRKWARKHGLIQ
jgi:transposase-like protein/Zn finger protein HypA/HybF involved in hydrogenase expression